MNWFDTVDFPKDGDGCRWDCTPQDPVTRVRFQGVGHVRVNQHRPVVGKVKTVSVKREGRKWFVVLSAEQDQPEPLPATGSVAGIDLGIANFLADSGGDFVPSPRHGRRASAKLQAAQQALSRFPRCKAKDRTANHQRAVEKVAQLHGKVRRQRLDHAHKTALGLVRAHDFIAHEDLWGLAHVADLEHPRPDPDQPGTFLPNGAAAKAGLNTSIHDAGWGVFLTILHAKAESAGREVIAVNPRNTSRTFVDRLVATLIHLRHDLPHSVLGLLFGVDRSTVTRAVAEIRPLLAERGCAVPDRPGLRLRTLPDVFAYAQAEGVELRLDATEIQVRRPPAGRGGRRAFVSGKKKQNTM